MQILFILVSAAPPECDLFPVSRAWLPSVFCEIGERLDYSEPVSGGTVLNITNIHRLVVRKEAARDMWAAVVIGDSGLIQNTVFAVDLQIDLDVSKSQVKSIHILDGKEKENNTAGVQLQKVSMFGNMTLKFGKLLDSNFSVEVHPWESSFKYNEIANIGINVTDSNNKVISLQSVLNCGQATAWVGQWCKQAEGTFLYENNALKILRLISIAVNTSVPSNISLQVATLYDRRNGVVLSLRIAFPGSIIGLESAYQDYYLGMLQTMIEIQFETWGLQEAWLSAGGINFEGDGKRLFFAKTKAVMELEKFNYLVCVNEFIDLDEKKCVKSCSETVSKHKQYARFCVSSCPGSKNDTAAICQCPKHLGYLENCMICAAGSYSNGVQCVTASQCSSGQILFGRGCYSACPDGVFSLNGICQEPQTVSECEKQFDGARPILVVYNYTTNYPPKKDNNASVYNYHHNFCAQKPPFATYKLNASMYIQRCSQSTGPDGSCVDLIKPICPRAQNMVLQKSECRAKCLNGQVSNGETCGETCKDELYRSTYSNCNSCKGPYDGGDYFVRGGMETPDGVFYCSPACSYANGAVCETPKTSLCPKWHSSLDEPLNVTCVENYSKENDTLVLNEICVQNFKDNFTNCGNGTNVCKNHQFACVSTCVQYERNNRCYSCKEEHVLNCISLDSCKCVEFEKCEYIYQDPVTKLQSCAQINTDYCPYYYKITGEVTYNYCLKTCPGAIKNNQCAGCPRYFDRLKNECTDECNYVNSSYIYDICEQSPSVDSENCPVTLQIRDMVNKFQCLTQCPDEYELVETMCTSCGVNEYWWRASRRCSANLCEYFGQNNTKICETLGWEQCVYYEIVGGQKRCLAKCIDAENKIVQADMRCQACPNGSEIDKSAVPFTCKCISGLQSVYFDKTAFECRFCPENQIHDGEKCECDKNFEWVNNNTACQKCPAGAESFHGQPCACDSSSMLTSAGCVHCIGHTELVGGICKCKDSNGVFDEGLHFNGSECIACLYNQQFFQEKLSCSCAENSIFVKDYLNDSNSRCVPCPPDAKVVENQCVCNNPDLRFDMYTCSNCSLAETNATGECKPLCPDGVKWDSQTLRCTCVNQYQIFVEETRQCNCPAGQRLDGSLCVCLDDGLIQHQGQCIASCPEGYLKINKDCFKGNECPTGYKKNKKDPKVCIPAKAPIDMGTASGIGILIAIVIVVVIWGAMICKKFCKGPSAEARSKRHKRHVPKARLSLERERPKGQVVL